MRCARCKEEAAAPTPFQPHPKEYLVGELSAGVRPRPLGPDDVAQDRLPIGRPPVLLQLETRLCWSANVEREDVTSPPSHPLQGLSRERRCPLRPVQTRAYAAQPQEMVPPPCGAFFRPLCVQAFHLPHNHGLWPEGSGPGPGVPSAYLRGDDLVPAGGAGQVQRRLRVSGQGVQGGGRRQEAAR